jgi:hypothetical protein
MRIRRWKLAPRIGIAVFSAGAMLIAASGAASANESLYGPPPPPVPVPGGYLTVVTSQTIGPGGGTIGPVSGGNLETTVVVPAGAFLTPLQVTITEPNVAGIGNAGFCGYQAVAGIGVVIQNPTSGAVDYSFLTHPLVVTISSPNIKAGDIIVGWNGRKFVRLGTTARNGVATLKITKAGFSFYAVLAPTGSPLGTCSTSGGAGGGAGGALGTTFGASSQSALRQFGFGATFLAALFRTPFGSMLPGLGVLAPRFSRALFMPVRSVAAWRR